MEDKEKKLEKAPNSLIFVSLASMYLDNGMVDEAIDLCKSGLEIEPDNEEAHLILARAEIEKGNISQASKRLTDILEHNPENATARELLDQIEPQAPEKVEEAVAPPVTEKEPEAAHEVVADISGAGEEPIEEMVMEGESLIESFGRGGPSVDDVIEEAIQAASQVSGLIPVEEEEATEEVLEEREKEEIIEKEEEPPAVTISEEVRRSLNEKMEKILKMEGIISCFFRLRKGGIIKHPELVGNVDDLVPLLDALLGSVKSAAGKLELGSMELLMIEIEKGVFYIYSKPDFDCFLVSQHINNFGFVKVMVPRILDDLSMAT
jgi:tetratricopeptide (TPR) repeat protein